MIDNFVVRNQFWTQDMEDLLFQGFGTHLDPVEIVPEDATIYDLLVKVGAFDSKSQARKNWTRGHLQPGFNSFVGIGKLRRQIWFWLPIDTSDIDPVEGGS